MLVLGLIDLPWWLLLLLFTALAYRYLTRDFDYFKKQGLPYFQPLPFIGTANQTFTKGIVQFDLDAQKQFGGDKVVGEFGFGPPSLLAFNADFLSQIMVKEFSSFANRYTIKTGDPMNDNMLVGLKDDHWKRVRNDMTPSFTSGKLKKMNEEINRCAQSLVNNLSKAAKNGGEIIAKDYTGAYTMDVIASIAFGIRVNSQEEPNNPFVQHAKEAFDVKLSELKMIIPVFFPTLHKLMTFLGYVIYIFGKECTDFFNSVTKQSMAMRKDEENSNRTDFLQLMLKAQRGEDIKDKDEDEIEGEHEESSQAVKGLTTDEIIANCILFFVAGYDTTASSLQFFLYNMARYPEIQEKLVEEIDTVLGDMIKVDNAKVAEMPYLDQCVSENLRLYPAAPRVERLANHDVTIDNIWIRKGMVVSIPIYAIHHDPEKWPEPERFDPERFSAENKKNRHPFHYLPFGQGPRICIGMRLALLEMKIAIIYMLRAFKISTCEKTVYPLTWETKLLLSPNEKLVVKVEPRKK